MKFETTAGELKTALRTLSKVAQSNFASPILNCVLIDGSLIRACNLDIDIAVTVPVRRAKGSACIPCRPLANLVSHIDAGEVIRIETGEQGATISFSGGRYDLPTMDPADFPSISVDSATARDVDGAALARAINFVAPCVSREETRYYLNGVHLDGDVVVATDGHRLACHPLGFDCGDLTGSIIPIYAVALLANLPPAQRIAVRKDPYPTMEITMAGVVMKIRLIDGNFPDWRRVVPKFEDGSTELALERGKFLRMLRRVSSVTMRGWACGVLAWAGGRVAPAIDRAEVDVSVREHLTADISGAAGSQAFNVRYLTHVLTILRSETVTMRTGDPRGPVLWRGEGDAFVVLMPMRELGKGGEMARGLLADLEAVDQIGAAA
ncbi:DNA polymerase III subunit beta [Ferirhizobium litorale]|uniref:Beta sliding clamp n=1 Tax=Ferirhizobium litorale TaxID=2927786 RepID=A0AAE3QK47_9HYPH|nr:DNA polymerase III subunit beta [Fererhizobium litorale]MDI7924573.1 DNA polymerase III subunit beta [Fererhizobium litorale]